MPDPTRRVVLESALKGAAVAIVGCEGRASDTAGDAPSCDAPDAAVPGGAYIGDVPFLEADTTGSSTRTGEGLDARMSCPLASLTSDTLVTAADQFYLRTEASTLLDLDQDWVIHVVGLVAAVDVRLADLLTDASPRGVVLMECSGNTGSSGYGLMSAASWTGIPLALLLDRLAIDPRATHVRVGGFASTRPSP